MNYISLYNALNEHTRSQAKNLDSVFVVEASAGEPRSTVT